MEQNGSIMAEKYLEPEELARQILAETPEAIDLFGSRDDLIAYIRKAMASDYRFTADQP